LKPDTPEEQVDALNGQLESAITQAGGKIDKVDKWGVRKLAYRVKKCNDGFFVLVSFHAKAETVKEVERRLRVSDLVLKYLTVRMDEKLKWLEKRKKARDKRAARRPAPVAPPQASPLAPGAPGAVVPGAPAPAHPAPGAPVTAMEATPAAPAAPVAPPAEAPAPVKSE
jgi:small subunit ribosomal protein S6